MMADKLSGGQLLWSIDDLISQAELKATSDSYDKIAGFSRDAVGEAHSPA